MKELSIKRVARRFDVVRCVTGDEHFNEGDYYASVGWNNGIGVQYESKNGNCETVLMCSGGIGRGCINNFDGSGKPSFEIVRDVLIIPE